MEAQSSQLAEAIPAHSTSPRVLIDGRKLGDGGIGVYISNLVEGLVALRGVQVTVLADRDKRSSLPSSERVEWVFDPAKPYSLDEYFLLPRRVDFSRYDIFHAPHYSLPFGIPIPTVVTIHDLIHITHPERFFYPYIARPLIRSAARRASAIVAVSRDTREQVIRQTGVSAADVRYIPNAIAPFLASSAGPLPVARPSDYLLAVISNTKPHKGIPDLLVAYRGFVERQKRMRRAQKAPTLKLVGFGAAKMLQEKRYQAMLDGMAGVEIVGAVDSVTLRGLYAGATALVVPSLAEGFCLPALEAQSVGTPVVCRPVAAIEELLTEQDIIADDLSARALEMAMHEAVARQSEERRSIPEHLARFSLDEVASQTLDLYHHVLAKESTR